MKLDASSLKKICLVGGGLILFYWLLNNFGLVGGFLGTLWGLIFPFVLGYILAFLLNLPMRFIEARLFRGRGGRLRRPLSFVLTLVLVLGVLVVAVVLLLPQLGATVATLARAMPGYLARAQKTLSPYLAQLPVLQEWLARLDVDWQSLSSQIIQLLQSGAGSLLSSAVGAATSIVNGLFSFFIAITFSCYLLLDKEHLTAQLQGLLQAYLPEARYQKVKDVATLTHNTYASFVSGQVTEAFIVTALYLVVLLVGGFKYALLISVLIGLTSLIPMIGPFLGCFVGIFLLFVSMGFWRTLAFVILFVVVQMIENNLIYPFVVGSSVGLPPIWILAAVMVGGGLSGIFGILFFIPLVSVVYTLLHRDARNRLDKKGIPSPVAAQPPAPKARRRPKRKGE